MTGSPEAHPDPIRVLRIIARLNVGGPAMHVVHLARGLDDRFSTRLIAGEVPPEEGDMAYFAQERGVQPHYLSALRRPVSPTDDLRALLAIRKEIRAFRPDIVHTHTAKAGALGRLAAILEGVPVIVHTYHGHVLGGSYFSSRMTRVYRQVERQLARGTDRLIALTEMHAGEMSGALGIAPPDRFSVIPLGLSLERFAQVDRPAARKALRAELGVPQDRPVVGIVGRLVPVKNHELLFDAFQRASATLPDAELWVVGSGEREGELRRLVESLGLSDRVRWLGWRQELEKIYPAFDLLALSSHDEGTPVALMEGLACGTPIVSTNVGGIREMLSRVGSRGLVVEPGDVDGLTQALVEGLAAASTSQGPDGGTDAARQGVVDGYSVAALCENITRLYLELLQLNAPDRLSGRPSRAHGPSVTPP